MARFIMNGLLISLIFMWTSSAIQPLGGPIDDYPTKLSTEIQTNSLNENAVATRRRKTMCGTKLDGKCKKMHRKCPSHLPMQKTQGKPYCPKRKRCCYPGQVVTTTEATAIIPGAVTKCNSEAVSSFRERHVVIGSHNTPMTSLRSYKFTMGRPGEQNARQNHVFSNYDKDGQGTVLIYDPTNDRQCMFKEPVSTYLCTRDPPSTGIWKKDLCNPIGRAPFNLCGAYFDSIDGHFLRMYGNGC